MALAAVLGMQIVAVHWGPAQAIFDTVDLQPDDWLLAIGVASSVLLLDEGRKFLTGLVTSKQMIPDTSGKSG
ncbi:MAG: cation transporting ATPase C-terminal domain-containing protein [Dechloromonas sp.]|uniref:Cation transporting ATPase C-terminal domain-containing protein n=1 Tax=Candidatus Dechloromonas phosphorivorans TaxID=2899244 RepID=A0A935N205_9RHOO|nr:cation transporting ATPase C-terminal domain-containing protein [Candidatus Dechloromonas phosphorivorans]